LDNIPSGQVTFLFTDIEGSTKLSQDFPYLLQESLDKHHSILSSTLESNGGYIFKTVGDAFCCAFENAADAVRAAIESQIRLSEENWGDAKIKVRMGIHRGNAEWSLNNYIGYITLARTARIMSTAYGGQILVSEDVFENARDNLDGKISFRDLGERRLKDLRYPIKLFQITAPELASEFPPLKTLDARPNNLPVQLTSFIGREKEIHDVKELMKNSRLITLTGPGGAGKTRLSLQIGADLIDDFANGVWFIDAAPITDESLLPQTINCALGIKSDPAKSDMNKLKEFLKDKELLMILDNCEQIINACSKISEFILSINGKIKIIASSREALRCRGEQIFRVPSLMVPEPGEEISMENLTQYESVKLFIERALAVDPDFEVDNESAPFIAEICHRLDGIPLAIELAAARINIFSPEKIYERLKDRFKFLTGGSRTALPRQRTLKSMVDWSYDLLSEKEKLLLDRLSIFSDGWTLEAAEEICSDENLEMDEIFELISRLAGKSLITTKSDKNRYNMLETIRQYCNDKLIEKNELDSAVYRHLNFFLKFAETSKDKSKLEFQKEWIEKFEAEEFNFRMAITNSIVRDNIQKGVQLCLMLCRYWETRGYNSEAINYLEEFLARESELDEIDKANLMQWLGTFKWITGDLEQAEYYYEKCHEINSKIGNKRNIGVSMNNLGILANTKGDYLKAKELNEESYKIFSDVNDEQLKADSLLNLGAPLLRLEEYDYAEKVFRESLKIYREIRDSRGIAMALSNLGSLLGYMGKYEQALKILDESLSLQRVLKDKRSIASTLENLGSVTSSMGFYPESEKYFKESITVNSELGNKRGLADAYNNYGFLKFRTGEFDISLELHKSSYKLRKEVNFPIGMFYSLIGISESLSRIDPELSAVVFGLTETRKPELNKLIDKLLLESYDNLKSLLPEKLGDKYKELSGKGKAMSQEEIDNLLKINEVNQ